MKDKIQAYLLTPVDDEDVYFTLAMFGKINRSINQVKEGMVTKTVREEELNQFLDNL
jgi:hypothetical protein